MSGWRKRALPILCGLYVASVVGATLLVLGYVDRWWPATLLGFGPRWPLLAPAVVLASFALWTRRRRWALLVAAAGLIVAGPYMDLCLPFPRSQPDASAGAHKLRVASYNIQERLITDNWVQSVVTDLNVDILALEECRTDTPGRSELYGYQLATVHDLCVFSRFPIVSVDSRDPKDALAKNGSGAIMRVDIDIDGQLIHVLALHLATVRDGLQAIRDDRLGGIPALRANIELRRWESEMAREWIAKSSGPTLVMGDLNLPVESDIYRNYWAHLINAFDECGTGYGNTKHTSSYGIRIDHILMSDAFHCESVLIGDQSSSDHAPIRAELRLSK